MDAYGQDQPSRQDVPGSDAAAHPRPAGLGRLAGARVGVVGLGRTGQVAAQVLVDLGARVTLLDSRPDAADSLPAGLRPAGSARSVLGAGVPGRGAVVAAVTGSDQVVAEALGGGDLDLVVVSPGVPATGPVLGAAVSAGLETWSEIELAWRLSQDLRPGLPWLTVTGTDGKTTTTGMLSAILTAAGLTAPAVGNIGVPALSVLAGADPGEHGSLPDALAVELSSFQLHTTRTLSPLAAACLNVSADHLDWHGGVEAYRADKARVYERAQRGAVYNLADRATEQMVMDADVVEGCRAVGFGLGAPGRGQLGLVSSDDAADGGAVLVDRAWHASRATHGLELATLADLAHLAPGEDPSRLPAHVVADALAAAAVALAHEAVAADASAVARGLRAFTPGAHRHVVVAHGGGVSWVDDSKATNTHATAAAFSGARPGSVVWLVGGDTKGADLTELVGEVAASLRGVVVLGKDPALVTGPLEAARRCGTLPADLPCHVVADGAPEQVIAEAVDAAAAMARPGDTVLMAPAAASWDQFRSYAQRGELFSQAARRRAAAATEATETAAAAPARTPLPADRASRATQAAPEES